MGENDRCVGEGDWRDRDEREYTLAWGLIQFLALSGAGNSPACVDPLRDHLSPPI